MLESSPWLWGQGRAGRHTNPTAAQGQIHGYVFTHPNIHLIFLVFWSTLKDLTHRPYGRISIKQDNNGISRQIPSEGSELTVKVNLET